MSARTTFSKFTRLTKRLLLPTIFASVALLSGDAKVNAADVRGHVIAAEELTRAFEYDKALAELDAAGAPDDPDVVIGRALVALYQGRCDDAAAVLSRPSIGRLERAEDILDIARGCVRATSAIIVEKDEDAGIEIRFQDEHDRVLFPILVDTVKKARDSLTRDLGATWPLPTRVVVVRDSLSLSVMTGLPYAAAQTTGTVAVAKWGRVTMLSPRASLHGYPYRDTLAHELTHLAVSRLTNDHAPLWLQEGLAKNQETRWRPLQAFDGRPSAESIVQRGIEKKLDLPLDHLGPSLAMLPSPEAALVAYAEVTSFVHRLSQQAPDTRVKVLAEFKRTTDSNDALKAATGQDLAAWDKTWRAWLATEPQKPLPSYFGLDHDPKADKELSKVRDHARLAELLLARKHADAAVLELAKVKDDIFAEPSMRALKMRALAEAGHKEEADALAADPKDVVTSYGPWWAMRGVLARAKGDDATAEPAFAEAVAFDPFDVEAACESMEDGDNAGSSGKTSAKADVKPGPLCDAAHAWIFAP